jgi:hypothetical protein
VPSSKLSSASTIGLIPPIPDPSALQLAPFQRATWLADTPPMLLNPPPA